MIKIEHFPQTETHYHGRKCCTQQIVINPNSMHRHTRNCRKHAQYKVSDKPMCAAHASQACLEWCFKNQDKE